jgi:hypothetical protein
MNNKTMIVKVKKNHDGDITDVMMKNGNVYSIDEAILMAKDGLIEDIIIGQSKNGREYLRSKPTGRQDDNLDNLPQF